MKGFFNEDNNVEGLITIVIIVLLLAILFGGSRGFGKAFSEEEKEEEDNLFPVMSNDDEVDAEDSVEGGCEA
ncbi:hypothetical protein SAMN00017405_2292 [Desulfonispora thiosulfatigenes DSM 11270]|uniref:Uncharacterized protein n=1 Tax=Desulfonispora thiosulfatigenes DSM 11270 TaxID=656914 RepID=A0A1W1VDW2_DESTI|nr:hypothetical protein [Desulfonispora thiosulfatigenes]SMB91403.1 hypothetical protein SAMN00017405_2292 [Desulfonispora thiosulfatigenes DSM 11270]